jgi:excisionase family DNA binding protein
MTVDNVTIAPLELLTVSEAARRLSVVGNTLRRRIESGGIPPDAFLLEGSKRLRSPLFVAPRLKELAKLVEAQTPA